MWRLWIFVALLFMSCSNSLTDMVDNYNEAFLVKEGSEDSNNEEFAASEMLYEKYFVADNETLNLFAPVGCSSVVWTLKDPSNAEKGSNFAKLFAATDVGYNKRRFVFYVPDSELEVGKIYSLTLQVVYDGKSYTDTCLIVIYKSSDTL